MISIVFKNNHFIAVDKPALWLSVPSRQGKQETRKVLGTTLQNDILKKQIYPVHRLDYEVSGIILFALTKEAHKDSQSWFEDKKVQKIYTALTQNLTHKHLEEKSEFLWKSKILRGKKRAYDHPQGKPSETFARVLTPHPLKWHLEPWTGRSHQLRYELSKNGYPIIGDTLYGSSVQYENGIALRAQHIHFPKEISEKWQLPNNLSVCTLF